MKNKKPKGYEHPSKESAITRKKKKPMKKKDGCSGCGY